MNRNIGLCIVYSIITLGIYSFYWMYKLNEETAAEAGREPTVSGGLLILLTIVTCGIYFLYWCYKQGEAIDAIQANHGQGGGNNAVERMLASTDAERMVTYLSINTDSQVLGDCRSETIQIVTGAKNVYEGMLCPAVLVGGKVAASAHDSNEYPDGIVIKDGKLRGVESHGMLCRHIKKTGAV